MQGLAWQTENLRYSGKIQFYDSNTIFKSLIFNCKLCFYKIDPKRFVED